MQIIRYIFLTVFFISALSCKKESINIDEKPDFQYTFNGTIMGIYSSPPDGYTVTLTNSGNFSKTVLSDINGEFTIPDVPMGIYNIELSKEGFGSKTFYGITVLSDNDEYSWYGSALLPIIEGEFLNIGDIYPDYYLQYVHYLPCNVSLPESYDINTITFAIFFGNSEDTDLDSYEYYLVSRMVYYGPEHSSELQINCELLISQGAEKGQGLYFKLYFIHQTEMTPYFDFVTGIYRFQSIYPVGSKTSYFEIPYYEDPNF